jgi:hypothetical protein
MNIRCISCGHNLLLDNSYDDFSGLLRCYVCDGLMEIKIADGQLQGLNMAQLPHRHAEAADSRKK